MQDGQGPLSMGPMWGLSTGFGTCCGYPFTGALLFLPCCRCVLGLVSSLVAGYKNNGISGPGLSGGSGISPNGW